MDPQNPAREDINPRGYLTFKAIKVEDGDRVSYIGAMPVFNLIDQRFIAPVASEGLSPEILKLVSSNGPVQRKTTPSHVQGIVDYIVEQAEKDEPWAFNAIVLYSTKQLQFEGISFGINMAGEARAEEAFSVGEGLHRCLAWGVALELAKVKAVRRPVISEAAQKRITRATIPVIVVEEPNLKRQKADFHKLNQQKALTATVLNLTDETMLSALTKMVISDVKLFSDRIDLNNASPGPKSDKLLSFAQLRFVVASCLLGKDTRSTQRIEAAVEKIVAERGIDAVRAELRDVFGTVVTHFGGLDKLHRGLLGKGSSGDIIRRMRAETLLTSNAAWRALFVALHEIGQDGIAVETAIDRVKHSTGISWARDSAFWVGNLIDADTGKLLSSRESIDAAADRLVQAMRAS
jgi:DGQHR domain-containing protein